MNNLSLFKWTLSISICLALYSCSTTKENTLPNPKIQEGSTKLSGRITNHNPSDPEANRKLTLTVLQPVTSESYVSTSSVNEDGSFTFFEIPLQCNFAIGYLRPERNEYDKIYVCLTSGKEAKIDILYDKTRALFKVINQTDSFGLTSTDLSSISRVENEIDRYHSPKKTTVSIKTRDEFVHQAKIKINNQLKKIEKIDTLSENAKNFVANNLKIRSLDFPILDENYKVIMRATNLNAGNKDVEDFNPQDLDKKQYAFLKDFDLNNPQYLYSSAYRTVLQKILSNDTLNISSIGDRPIDQWTKEVKNSLSKLVGFDKGLFYDLLAVNSYTLQFDNELRPLSGKQEDNINNYFKDDKADIAKMLLRKNDEIVKLAAQRAPLVVNETPAVSKEKLMDAIVSKYKGKAVVVDLWVTWCPPYLGRMKEYASLRSELKDRNVVFVHITNNTSPQKLWEERIKWIGGEHYYLNQDEWKYIWNTFNEEDISKAFNGKNIPNTFNFEYIPTYLIFDTKGKLVEKYMSYRGNETMKAAIEKLLP